MAVETFFLFGFKALDDLITETFPPSPENPLLRIVEKIESNQISDKEITKTLHDSIMKYMEIGFQFKNLKFHFLKQLEPAYGHKIVLEIKTLKEITIEFIKSDQIINVEIASKEDMSNFPIISISIELIKKYFIEGLDVLRLITLNEIEIDKFYDLNNIIVRALLGLSSAFFLRKEFRERVKRELNSLINSV